MRRCRALRAQSLKATDGRDEQAVFEVTSRTLLNKLSTFCLFSQPSLRPRSPKAAPASIFSPRSRQPRRQPHLQRLRTLCLLLQLASLLFRTHVAAMKSLAILIASVLPTAAMSIVALVAVRPDCFCLQSIGGSCNTNSDCQTHCCNTYSSLSNHYDLDTACAPLLNGQTCTEAFGNPGIGSHGSCLTGSTCCRIIDSDRRVYNVCALGLTCPQL